VGLVDPTDGLQPDWYQVCVNGYLNNVQVTNEYSNDPFEAPAQKRALAQINALMAHSTSLLPASAWADPTIRPYVPTRYGLGWTDFAVPDPSKLPSPAKEALAKVLRHGPKNGRPTLTPDQARALLAAFRQSRIKVVSNAADSVAFQVPATGANDTTRLSVAPDWPNSPLWDANRC